MGLTGSKYWRLSVNLHRHQCQYARPTRGERMVAQRELTDNAAVLADPPLVVCVTADTAARQRVVNLLNGTGVLLICPDLDSLRGVLGQFNQPGWAAAVAGDSGVPGRLTFGELV